MGMNKKARMEEMEIEEMDEIEMEGMEKTEMEIEMEIMELKALHTAGQMVPDEEDRVERFIGGLPDNIQGNVIAANPRQNTSGQNVARAYTARNNERKGYVGPLPYCNKCRLNHEGLCTMIYGNCKKVGHQTRDYRVAIAPNTQRVQVGNQQATTKAYAIGGGGTNPDSNVVMGTFLLNNCYASMLFDSGADRSFVSTTFSALLDVAPTTLDTSYAVELADGRILETNIVLRALRISTQVLKVRVWLSKVWPVTTDDLSKAFQKIARPMMKLTQKSMKLEWEKRQKLHSSYLNAEREGHSLRIPSNLRFTEDYYTTHDLEHSVRRGLPLKMGDINCRRYEVADAQSRKKEASRYEFELSYDYRDKPS
ncbi:putative reverse transcriptase domain-containing protein [Tanacetum coccineum]